MFTEADLEFLRRPLHGFLTVAGPQPPEPRPVWFEAVDDGTLQLFSARDVAKVRRLRADPRASIVVAAPVGEPERWVSAAGRVSIEADGAQELAERLAARYWDLAEPGRRAALEQMRQIEPVRLVLHPERVQRYEF